MAINSCYLVDLSALTFSEDAPTSSWVHALPIGSYKHPQYGTIDITADRAKKFAESVTKKVLNIDPNINFMHAGDGEAAGWVKNAEPRSDGVWLFIDWTKDAVQKIKDKVYRYFSAEYADEWVDPQGNKFTDVIRGGALTNRPFMKNLVPINLSEAVYDNAFELVSIISGMDVDSLKGGKSMELSDEAIEKIVTKLAEKTKVEPPKPDPAQTVSLTDIPELKALAEENPLVKALIVAVETQNANIAESEKKLKEQDIANRLSEFDRSKIVLSPVAKAQVVKLLAELPTTSHQAFWDLLTEMKKSSSFLVELGERAGATVNYGSPKSAIKLFNELADKIVTEEKKSPTDAFEMAAAREPELYKRYRNETMSGVAN